MADIFISYSSKDREKAEQLTELLISAGLSVWIDKLGIEVATSWSAEIVDAIDNCKALVVLLSENSVVSKNVVQEVALAFEKNKKILPLDIEPVALTRDLQYHLAGIQRASISNIDAVIRALANLGLEATQAPNLKLVKETDSRKSVMILPFEDLSPTGDNGWFADGLAAELIIALSSVKALKVADQQSTKEFKKYNGHLTTYAKEMSIRYFIEGSVRRFGDQIKISSSLLDIESGDQLWQGSIKGAIGDIFTIQEEVAEKVVEGLKIHLGSDEKKKFREHGTDNAEAYELYMRAEEYFARQTKEGLRLAAQLYSEATVLDPGYAIAYYSKAHTFVSLYSNYDRIPALLDEAETLCKKAIELKPDLYMVYNPLSRIYMYRGELAKAEETAREFTRKDPLYYFSHFTLGFFYDEIKQPARSIAPYEEAVRLAPDNLASMWNLILSCDNAGEQYKCAFWAETALPRYERYLRLHPDDESMRVLHAFLLLWSGRTGDAFLAATKLLDVKDAISLFNTACLFSRLGDKMQALKTFLMAIEAGIGNTLLLNDFLTDEKSGIASLAGTPEYEGVKKIVEELEREAEIKKQTKH